MQAGHIPGLAPVCLSVFLTKGNIEIYRLHCAPVRTCKNIVFIFIDATLLMIVSISASCLSALRPEDDGNSEEVIHTAFISEGRATV